MRAFDVQSVGIPAPYERAFAYIAAPEKLPEWTHAFQRVAPGRAWMATPQGSVEVGLAVAASPECGTIDWTMTFPDGSIARAYSRLVPDGGDRSIYSFVLVAPPVPLEQLEGTLQQQSATLRDELARLSRVLGGTLSAA